jgi:hypothetical protein
VGKKTGPGEAKVDVVLIGYNKNKRLDWLLGLVVSLSPASDSCVQVVRVKTALGELTRPVQCVFSLDMPEGLSGHDENSLLTSDVKLEPDGEEEHT